MVRAMRTLLFVVVVAACTRESARPAPGGAEPAKVLPPAMTLVQAGIVPAWLDKGADPCKDFFAYACGGFTKTAVIPPDRSSWGAVPMVVKEAEELEKKVLEDAAAKPGTDPVAQKIGAYYAACMD